MTRKRTNDRPLFAARLRPFRRPPKSGNAPGAPALRLNHGTRPAAVASHPVVRSLKIAEQVAESLHLALEVFARIIGEVSELDELVRRRVATKAMPADADVLIADCARALAAIDQAATCADAFGAPLFDGAWHADLLDGLGRFSTRVDLPRVAVDRLGSEGVGGRLTSLLTPAGECMLLDRPAVASAVIRSAALWLAGERERVFRILAEVVEPLVAEMEVIEANTCASQLAGDSILASDLAQITKLTALANATPLDAANAGDANGPQPNPFRIRHHDDD